MNFIRVARAGQLWKSGFLRKFTTTLLVHHDVKVREGTALRQHPGKYRKNRREGEGRRLRVHAQVLLEAIVSGPILESSYQRVGLRPKKYSQVANVDVFYLTIRNSQDLNWEDETHRMLVRARPKHASDGCWLTE